MPPAAPAAYMPAFSPQRLRRKIKTACLNLKSQTPIARALLNLTLAHPGVVGGVQRRYDRALVVFNWATPRWRAAPTLALRHRKAPLRATLRLLYFFLATPGGTAINASQTCVIWHLPLTGGLTKKPLTFA